MKLQMRRKIALTPNDLLASESCDTGGTFFSTAWWSFANHSWAIARAVRGCRYSERSDYCAFSNWCASCPTCAANCSSCCGQWTMWPSSSHFWSSSFSYSGTYPPAKHPSPLPPKHTQLVSLDPFDTLQPPNERVLLLPSETQNSSTTATFLFFTPHIYPLVWIFELSHTSTQPALLVWRCVLINYIWPLFCDMHTRFWKWRDASCFLRAAHNFVRDVFQTNKSR